VAEVVHALREERMVVVMARTQEAAVEAQRGMFGHGLRQMHSAPLALLMTEQDRLVLLVAEAPVLGVGVLVKGCCRTCTDHTHRHRLALWREVVLAEEGVWIVLAVAEQTKAVVAEAQAVSTLEAEAVVRLVSRMEVVVGVQAARLQEQEERELAMLEAEGRVQKVFARMVVA
tara:strand:+ start:561 stop:1079 length:519 start_codon:yes stop_codon:yes gene_type:complete